MKIKKSSYMLNKIINYHIFNAKKIFTLLRQAFIQAQIFEHFDLKCHIQIEIVVPSYAIKKAFSLLSFNKFG